MVFEFEANRSYTEPLSHRNVDGYIVKFDSRFTKLKGSSASMRLCGRYSHGRNFSFSLSPTVNIGDSTPERFCYRMKEEESEEAIGYVRQVFEGSAAKQNAEKRHATRNRPGACRKVDILLGELTSFAMHDSALKAILRSPFFTISFIERKATFDVFH